MKGSNGTARIGMVVQHMLGTTTYRMFGDRHDVTVHFTRIPVTRIAPDDGPDAAFDTTRMQEAAELLATASVDVIA